MHVRTLLPDNHKVISVAPATPVHEVAGILRDHRIGAVLVLEGSDIAGVLSERDIVRSVAEHGGRCLDFAASKLMTKDVITCDPEDSIDRVMEMMTENRFRHLPVVNDSGLMGIISIGDVVKSKIQEAEAEAKDLRAYIATA